MDILGTLLKLLSAVGPVTAALPEFAALVNTVKDTLGSDDQDHLQAAYDLAKEQSDEAHNELQRLISDRT